jgi:LPS-assembly protein
LRAKRYLLLTIVFFILRAHLSTGEEEFPEGYRLDDRSVTWEITAKRLSYMEKEGLYVAEGDVVITRNGQVLSTQKAIYNKKTGIAEVSDGFRLEARGDLLTGEKGTFNLNNYTGVITGGSLFISENNYYIYGDVMEKVGPNTYFVKGCRVTTCDGPKPDWSISGSEVRITVEGYGKVKHASFKIRDLPVFYLPYAIFPVKTKRQTGVLPPRVGYSNRTGADVEVPIFWAISDQTDATFYERFMSKRGLMQGFEFRYVAEHESKGLFLFDILSDREEKDLNDPDDVELSPFPRTNSTRYWMRSKTDQQLPLGLSARLDTDYVSDQDYLKEFRGSLYGFEARPERAEEFGRPVGEIQSPTRRSALRLARDQDAYSLQGSASYYQNPLNPPKDETSQPLAGLDFALLPRPLAHLPLFLKFHTDYDYVWRDVGQKGHRMYFSPELSYPLWFGRYLQFEPAVKFERNDQWLDGDQGENGHHSEDAYQMQARLSTILERVFDFEWKGANKLKHKMTPSLTYTFRDHRDRDIPQPWFEPIDAEGRINQIAFSLENFLDARLEDDNGGVTYAQWGTFSLIQRYDIDEARPFLPLVAVLSLTPFPDLNFDAQMHWDYQEDDISFADLSLDLAIDRSGGRKDYYELDYQYTMGGGKSLNYNLHVNLLRGFSAGTSRKRDLNARRNIETAYWLDYQSQCWGVRVLTEKLDGVDSIVVTFRLLGLGGV